MATRSGLVLAALACAGLLAGCTQGGGMAPAAAGATNNAQPSPANPQQTPVPKTDDPNGNRY